MADISKIKLPDGVTYSLKDANAYKMPSYGVGTTDPAIRPYVAFARANRLAFLPADQIIIEKTTDGGQTWTSAGASDSTKKALFATRGASLSIPILNGERSTNCGLRITITAMKYNVPEGTAETAKYNYWSSTYVKSAERYCNLRELWFWLSSASDSIRCQVYAAKGGSPNTWATCFNTDFAMKGWSGSDWVRFGNYTFGGGTNQTGNYWNLRIVFWSRMNDGASEFTGTTNQSIAGISGYGDSVWTASNSLMKEDHLYSWDSDLIATFPAQVKAASFNGSGAPLTNLNATNIASGTLNSERLPSSGATAGTYGPGGNQSPASGGTFGVPDVTVDAKGRVTGVVTRTITLPGSSGGSSTLEGLTDTNISNPRANQFLRYVNGKWTNSNYSVNVPTEVYNLEEFTDEWGDFLEGATMLRNYDWDEYGTPIDCVTLKDWVANYLYSKSIKVYSSEGYEIDGQGWITKTHVYELTKLYDCDNPHTCIAVFGPRVYMPDENDYYMILVSTDGRVPVEGTTPVIDAVNGFDYKCGECTTLDITLPQGGRTNVIFQSGSTPTVLTITPPTGVTVKWANGFNPASLNANTAYEINIENGLGTALSWT